MARQVIVTPAAIVKMRRQRFIDAEGILPRGVITSFVGRGGEGKTAYALDLVARITQGTLKGELYGKPSAVLIAAPEDDKATQLVPRLIAAGANVNLVGFIDGHSIDPEGFEYTDSPTLGDDLKAIGERIIEHGAVLLLLDPITATMSGDLNKAQDVRRELARLDALAKRLEICVLSIQHVRKGKGGDLADRASGSHAFRDVVRSSVQFATDQESGHHIATLEKSNYSGDAGKSWAFSLEACDVEDESGETFGTIRVQHHGVSVISVSDCLSDPEDRADRQDEAVTFLIELLGDGNPIRYSNVLAAAKTAGISESRLKRAKVKAGIESTRVSEQAGGSVWQLKQS